MVLTRAAAKSGKTEDTAVVPSPVKKRRVEPSRKRRRGKQVELCQLNLDVLFLVRTFPCMRVFIDRFLMDAMFIARRIRSPLGPLESCAHV